MIPEAYHSPTIETLRDWRIEMQTAGVGESVSRGILARVIVRAIPRFISGATEKTAIGLANAMLDDLYGLASISPEAMPARRHCLCDLARPLVDPPDPYTGDWLAARNDPWLIASPFEGRMTYGEDAMTLACNPNHNGCCWHVRAWAIGIPGPDSPEWTAGNTAPLRRTGVCFLIEVRTLG